MTAPIVPPAWLRITGMLVLGVCWACCFAAMLGVTALVLPRALPQLINGEKSPLRNLLELVSFAATGAAALVALASVPYARRQLKEAENTRRATMYLQVSQLWTEPRAVESRLHVLALRDRFKDAAYNDTFKQSASSVSDYIKQVLVDEKSRDRAAQLQHTYILTLIEDIGVLCDRNYVHLDDVLRLIASPLTLQMDLLQDYITTVRADARSNYEHAVTLYKQATEYRKQRNAA